MGTRFSYRCSQRFPAASLPMVVVVLLTLASVAHADDAANSNSVPPVITASLEYQETPRSIINWGVSITPRTAPFRKEPLAGSGKVYRGVLNFSGNATNSIPFLWQVGQGKVFLDLKHNEDLGAGASFSTVIKAANYQTFTGIHLQFDTPSGKCPVLMDLSLMDYGNRPNCYAAVRSFWHAKVNLQNEDWQIGLLPNDSILAGSFDNTSLLWRRWQDHDKEFNGNATSLDTLPFSRKLFAAGHAYQLTCSAGSNVTLRITEEKPALGELKITGKSIRRLLLPGNTYFVVLDEPAALVQVPVGNYRAPTIWLESGGVTALCNSDRRISVGGKTPATLAAGGPLTNFVAVSRQGQNLRLDYKLIGLGGETYQFLNQNTAHPPEFAIYRGEKQIASGKFEFG